MSLRTRVKKIEQKYLDGEPIWAAFIIWAMIGGMFTALFAAL